MKRQIRALARGVIDDLAWIRDAWSSRLTPPAIGVKPSRWLIASDRRCYTSEEQLHPLRKHRRILYDRFGIAFRFCDLRRALEMPSSKLRNYSVIGLKVDWRTSVSDAEQYVRHFAALAPAAKLVYFDGDDDLCIAYPSMAEHVHMYVKKHFFVDEAEACLDRVGKSNLTDFVAKRYGVGTDRQAVKSSRGLSQHLLPRVFVGWNIALDSWFERREVPRAVPASTHREIDIWCRASAPLDSWIFNLRNAPVEQLASVAGRWRMLLPSRERLGPKQYYHELRSSKICISPFGYGELCWRDFEAIRSGCVVVKPDMSHLVTRPDVFVPNKTYVPVRWDWSNLVEQCERLLQNDQLRMEIASNANLTLERALTSEWFCGVFGELANRLRATDSRL